jgi:hypothetical protein
MAREPTVRGALSRAAAALREHWRPLVAIALALFVPVGLLDVLDERVGEIDSEELDLAGGLGVLAIVLSRATSALFGEILLAGVVASAVSAAHGGEAQSLRHLLRTIPYARLVAIDVLFVVGLGVGLVLFVVPGVLFLGLFGLAAPLAKIEGLGVRAAFRRSRELVRGRLGLVLAVLVPLSLFSEAASEAAQAAGVWALGHGLAGEWAGAVVAELVSALPWALASVALVYELKAAGPAAVGVARPAACRFPPPPPR